MKGEMEEPSLRLFDNSYLNKSDPNERKTAKFSRNTNIRPNEIKDRPSMTVKQRRETKL